MPDILSTAYRFVWLKLVYKKALQTLKTPRAMAVTAATTAYGNPLLSR